MNIYFPSFPSSIQLPVLKNNILTIQQKKILLIAYAAFAFLAACYIVKRCSSALSIKRSDLKNILQSGDQTHLLAYLAKYGNQVKELNLIYFLTLNDQDLETLARQCPNLQKLTIHSKEITDQGTKHLQALTALKSLSLSECNLITNQGLQHLQLLIALQSLNLWGCYKITDQGLQYLQVFSALQSLNLSYCDGITNQGLQFFQTLKALQSLDLRKCQQLTSQDIQQLKNQMPGLIITS